MPIFLHRAKPSNQILPKRKVLKSQQLSSNIKLNKSSGPKRAWFCKIACSPEIYPILPIFLHWYVRQIWDILQLCLLLRQKGQFQLREHQLLLCEDLKQGGVVGELAEVVRLLPGEIQAAVEEKASESNNWSVDPGLRTKGSVADVQEEEEADEMGGWNKHPRANAPLLRLHRSTDKEKLHNSWLDASDPDGLFVDPALEALQIFGAASSWNGHFLQKALILWKTDQTK